MAERDRSQFPPSVVLLERMPQQTEVRAPEDDWTGLTDAAARRKLQNRLHQRTYRRRRNLRKAHGSTFETLICDSTTRHDVSEPLTDCGSINSDLQSSDQSLSYSLLPSYLRGTATFPGKPSNPCNLNSAQTQKAIEQFERLAYQEYLLGSPRLDLLLTLIQFNVFRALVSNNHALGFSLDWLNDDAVSPFNQLNTETFDLCSPPSLHSTPLQRTISHHPWIDLFPVLILRDNLLRKGESFDDTPLCHDLVEVCHSPGDRTGLIVWGEPWDPSSWEVTEGFAKKWSWILRGCWELQRSTNYWREKRGETKLFFDVSIQ